VKRDRVSSVQQTSEKGESGGLGVWDAKSAPVLEDAKRQITPKSKKRPHARTQGATHSQQSRTAFEALLLQKTSRRGMYRLL
jgi:hypothetical protein